MNIPENLIEMKEGIFAKQDIPIQTIVCQCGRVEEKQDFTYEIILTDEKNNTYLFFGDPNPTINYAGSLIKNSQNPNVEFYLYNDDIYVMTTRDIKRGEELFYKYCWGYDIDNNHIYLKEQN